MSWGKPKVGKKTLRPRPGPGGPGGGCFWASSSRLTHFFPPLTVQLEDKLKDYEADESAAEEDST
jgi:hypothetical protein